MTANIRQTVVADNGPVAEAARILAEHSTLAEHVTVDRFEWTTAIEATGPIPYDMWGSGTQALWRLLCAIAYSADTVSMYEVVSRLNDDNRRAVAAALSTLCIGAEAWR